jgi:hypothetical protein
MNSIHFTSYIRIVAVSIQKFLLQLADIDQVGTCVDFMATFGTHLLLLFIVTVANITLRLCLSFLA